MADTTTPAYIPPAAPRPPAPPNPIVSGLSGLSLGSRQAGGSAINFGPTLTNNSNPFANFPTTINSSNTAQATPSPLPVLGAGQKYYGVSSGDTAALDAKLAGITGNPIQNALQANPVSAPAGHPGFNPDTNLPNPPPPPPTQPVAQPSTYDTILGKIGGLTDTLGTKGSVTQDLQKTYGLDAKTQDATTAYNNYQSASLALQQRLESMRTGSGGLTGGAAAEIDQVSRAGNANLANLAVIAQAASGNLQAAQNIIKAKLDAQFQPVQDQIDYLTKYAQLNNANLTDAEKAAIQLRATQLQNNTDLLKTAMNSAHQFALSQGITNPSVLAAIDAARSPAEAYQAVGMNSDGTSVSGGAGNGGGTNTNMYGFNVGSLASNSPYAPYVANSVDGTPYVNQDQLKNLTPYQQQDAARQFAAAGIKVLQPDEASKIQNIDVTKQNLNQLGQVTNEILGSGLYGRTIGAAWNVIAGKLQLDPKISSFNTYRDTAINTIQALAGGSGSGFRLNQAEIDTATSNIPTITDNLETASQKITNLNSFLNKWTKELLPASSVNTGAGGGNGGSNVSIGSTRFVQDSNGRWIVAR